MSDGLHGKYRGLRRTADDSDTASTQQAKVEVGQRYHGWNRTWEVVRVWEKEGVAEIVDVIDSHRKGRLPLTQFAELRHG